MSTKKTLASSICALQQQVRDLTNKQKNSLKTSPIKTTEERVIRKQNTGSNGLKTPPANTTEAGVLRRQNTPGNLKTPPANTTERGVMRKQNTVDTTIKITPTTTTSAIITTTPTTKQGEPERSTTKIINADAKKETTVALEKVSVETLVNSPSALHVQGVPSRALLSRQPTNTHGKDGTASAQGKLPPVKRKASAIGQGGAKVAKVQVPKENQPSAMPERDDARLASQLTGAMSNGAKE